MVTRKFCCYPAIFGETFTWLRERERGDRENKRWGEEEVRTGIGLVKAQELLGLCLTSTCTLFLFFCVFFPAVKSWFPASGTHFIFKPMDGIYLRMATTQREQSGELCELQRHSASTCSWSPDFPIGDFYCWILIIFHKYCLEKLLGYFWILGLSYNIIWKMSQKINWFLENKNNKWIWNTVTFYGFFFFLNFQCYGFCCIWRLELSQPHSHPHVLTSYTMGTHSYIIMLLQQFVPFWIFIL